MKAFGIVTWLKQLLTKHTDSQPCRAEIGIEPALKVLCPCGCKDGVLISDGRNIDGTLTFLICSSCRCTYCADDSQVST